MNTIKELLKDIGEGNIVLDEINKLPYEELVQLMKLLHSIEYYKYILDEDKRIKCYLDVNESISDFYLKNLLTDLTNDEVKIKYCNYLYEEYYKVLVICSIKDEKLRIKSVNMVKPMYNVKIVLRSIKDDSILLDYYKECRPGQRLIVVQSLNDDANKIAVINNFKISDRVDIINSFNNIENKKKYALLPEYSTYQLSLIEDIKDDNFIMECFELNPSEKYRRDLISITKNYDLKKRLINHLEPSVYKSVMLSNYKNVKERLLSEVELPNINYDVDNDITLGVELEACGEFAKEVMLSDHILNNWKVTSDESVARGLEIVSPILRFQKEDLLELKYICNFMHQYHFYTDSTCGGHIHLGFDYFETKEQFNAFLRLYVNVEKILYVICNREGNKKRDNITKYAKYISTNEKNTIITSINMQKIESMGEYVELVTNNQYDRFYGLNMKNVGKLSKNTIEFRMPNGEIQFDELINNIRLFVKLFEVTKKLDDPYNYYLFEMILSGYGSSKERLNYLLDLLFDDEEEKEIYRNRFKANKKVLVLKKY